MGALVVVTGCGTGIGKTHTTDALLRRLTERGVVGSCKPIETGVPDGQRGGDDDRLARAAMFHVKQRYTFVPPLSPHLAAEMVGVSIDLAAIADDVSRGREHTTALVVELAGGLFSPLSLTTTNADLVAALKPDVHLVIAADRIGVLHDVLAVVRSGPRIDAVVLVADAKHDPAQDPSPQTNARELRRLGVPCLGTLPRAPSAELAQHAVMTELVARIPIAPPPSA